jgi:uncharacterized membrane protein YozB (DUF420 family)
MDYSKLPTINAVLNTASFVLLMLGYFFIRRRNIDAHIRCMIAACISSTLFLISYLTYHYHTGSKHFEGVGTIRFVYFAILISHTILAIVIVPMILKTLYHGWRDQRPKHVGIARITLPLWSYVSVTGVVVYLMLYQFKP